LQRPPGAELHAIKLRHVRYVLAAAEFNSFRRAAAALNIEQSTISRRIRDLESRLGAPVFERSRCGVRLTHAGERFLEGARAAVTHLETATAAARAIGRSQAAALHLGVLEPDLPPVLEDLLRRLALVDRAPRLTLHRATSAEHLAAVDAGRIDVAFIAGASVKPGIRCAPAWSERLTAAMPLGHPLCAQPAITWRDLAPLRLIFSTDNDGGPAALATARIGPADFTLQAVGREALLFLVAMGQGVTVLTASQAARPAPGVVFRPIHRAIVHFNAVWSSRNEKPSLTRLLRVAGIET